MLEALGVLLQGDEVCHGFFTAIIAAHDQLQFNTHGECSSGSGGGGMMQVILPEFVDYPQLLHALVSLLSRRVASPRLDVLAASVGVESGVANDLLSVRAAAPVTRCFLRLSTTVRRLSGGDPIYQTACVAGPALARAASTSRQSEVGHHIAQALTPL